MNYDKLAGNGEQQVSRKRGLGRPFQPGVSGNPSGRPPKSLMQRMYEEKANDPEFLAKWWQAEEQRLLSRGMAGVLGTREMMERVDGKVVQQVEMSVSLSLAETMEQRRLRLMSDAA